MHVGDVASLNALDVHVRYLKCISHELMHVGCT